MDDAEYQIRKQTEQRRHLVTLQQWSNDAKQRADAMPWWRFMKK